MFFCIGTWKNKFSCFHPCSVIWVMQPLLWIYSATHYIYGYYHQTFPLSCSALVSNQYTVRRSAFLFFFLFFFCTREQDSVFAFTLWGLFAEGLRHTQKFLTHLPHYHAKFCNMFGNRQTDRQTDRTGTKGPRPNVDPLWDMATLVRHSNKKWSPRPLQPDLRGDDLRS